MSRNAKSYNSRCNGLIEKMSGLERDLAYALDLAGITDWKFQPERVEYDLDGKKCQKYPDFAVYSLNRLIECTRRKPLEEYELKKRQVDAVKRAINDPSYSGPYKGWKVQLLTSDQLDAVPMHKSDKASFECQQDPIARIKTVLNL